MRVSFGPAVRIALCVSLGLVATAAWGAEKAELQKRLNQMKADLAIAKSALQEADRAEAKARQLQATRPPDKRVPKAKTLQEQPEPGISVEEQRRNAANALERLQTDTRLDRNRKLDELLLDQLRRQQ